MFSASFGRQFSPLFGPLIEEWVSVSAPVGWTWTLPFTIQKKNRDFRPDPSFNLQTYANITVSKTYYVDKTTGNNSNTGLDWDNALADYLTAVGKADVDRIYLRGGDYFYLNQRANPTRSIEVIAVGGTATISSDVYNQLGAFTPVSNHYTATISGGAVLIRVHDVGFLAGNGNPTILTLKTSEAEVDATAGSYYQSGTTVYIHTSDNRAPDGNIRYYTLTRAMDVQKDNLVFYFENVKIDRTLRLRSLSATGGLKGYFKNCEIQPIVIAGVDELIFDTVTGTLNSADLANYDILNTIVPKIIEIDCTFGYCGLVSGDQASTAHNGTNIVRINGDYHYSAGQCIAEAGATTKTWCLGSETHHSTSGIGYYTAGTMWLDCCWSHDNSIYDLQGAGTIYIRNFNGELGINNGTVLAY